MQTFLPSVHKAGIGAQAEACGMSQEAAAFAHLWMQALGDRAQWMACDARLVRAAKEHAEYLIGRTPEQMMQHPHIGKDGSTANERVRASGYSLPSGYLAVGNNVESAISGNEGRGADETAWAFALRMLLTSPSHYAHMMCVGMFAPHTMYGVGEAKEQYVVLTCPPEGSNLRT